MAGGVLEGGDMLPHWVLDLGVMLVVALLLYGLVMAGWELLLKIIGRLKP